MGSLDTAGTEDLPTVDSGVEWGKTGKYAAGLRGYLAGNANQYSGGGTTVAASNVRRDRETIRDVDA
jgi:hypothetical protein